MLQLQKQSVHVHNDIWNINYTEAIATNFTKTLTKAAYSIHIGLNYLSFTVAFPQLDMPNSSKGNCRDVHK